MGQMIGLGVDEFALIAGRLIIDSSTTDTYFLCTLVAPLRRAWRQITGDNFGHDLRILSPCPPL